MNLISTRKHLRSSSRVVRIGLSCCLLAGSSFAQGLPYGTGTRDSSGNVPILTSADARIGNANFALTTSNAIGGSAALTLLSFDRARVPFLDGSTLWIDPSLFRFIGAWGYPLGGVPGAPGAGSGSLTIPIPANLPLEALDMPLYAQSLVLEPSAGRPLSSTAGLEIYARLNEFVYVAGYDPGSLFGFEFLVDRATMQPAWTSAASGPFAEDLAIHDQGRSLFSTGIAYVRRIDLTLGRPQWSTLQICQPCHDLEIDEARQLLYFMDGLGTAGVELVAIDIDPRSSRYGQRVATTVGLAGTPLELRLEALRSDGNEAFLLDRQLGVVRRVDTDPASATYMQILQTVPVPLQPGSMATRARVTPSDRSLWVATESATSPEIQRLDLSTGLWFDENPMLAGIQGIGARALPPVTVPDFGMEFAFADSGAVALVTGTRGRSLDFSRIDLTPSQPASFVWTSLALPSIRGVQTVEIEFAPASTTAYAAVSGSSSSVISNLYAIDVPLGQVTRSLELRGAATLQSIAVR